MFHMGASPRDEYLFGTIGSFVGFSFENTLSYIVNSTISILTRSFLMRHCETAPILVHWMIIDKGTLVISGSLMTGHLNGSLIGLMNHFRTMKDFIVQAILLDSSKWPAMVRIIGCG